MPESVRETRTGGVRLRLSAGAARALLAFTVFTAVLAGDAAPAGLRLEASEELPRGGAARLETMAMLAHLPSTDSVRALAEQIGAQPAIAGTESMAEASRWLRRTLTRWGLKVTTHRYEVYMPHARRVQVQRIDPTLLDLQLDEEPVPGDVDSADPHYLAVAGYSGQGDVVAAVVYANYGTRDDFTALSAFGIDVQGKVALIRYGGSFRGSKVRNAVRAGAAAVLLYSDPQEDGFFRGDVYPSGPFRPRSGIQRGSVKIGPPGDPTTPGWPSLPGAHRVEPGAEVPSIPVVPIGYGAAAEILPFLGGPEVPGGWQGALPFRYHAGGSGVRVRVTVELDDAPFKMIYNTIGWLRGSAAPDEWVIVGAHRDAWTNGAMDNVSGTVSVLEAARALATLRDRGLAPRRSILFAFWDAEEWGLIGSAEWVEEFADELSRSAVAYINQDGIAGGPFFGAVASPSLRRLLMEVADSVPDPVRPNLSVYRAWRERAAIGAGVALRIDIPGAGSDYASFLGRLGVPSIGFGFSGGSGVYHSAYDTAEYMRRFGDPGYRQHRAAAAITAGMAWRLANDELLPLEFGATAAALERGLEQLDASLRHRRWSGRLSSADLRRAIERFRRAATDLAVSSGTRVVTVSLSRTESVRSANLRLRQAVRQFVRPEGTAIDSWYRNLVMAPDTEDAYVSRMYPDVFAALSAGDPVAAGDGIDLLASRIELAASQLLRAAGLLAGEPATATGY